MGQPSTLWSSEFTGTSGSLTDRAVNVAASETHAYIAGKRSSTSGAQYELRQHVLTTGTLRSSASFPVFADAYEPICIASYHVYYEGEPVLINDAVQLSFMFVAGTKEDESGVKVPAIAAFETDPDDSPNIGNLRLIWSWVGEPGDEDEVPVAITVDGAYVAVATRLTRPSSGLDVGVHLLDIGDGSDAAFGQAIYSSAGNHDEVAVGVALDCGFVIVGGHGYNGSGHPADMMALAFNIVTFGSDPPGTLYGPTFVAPASGAFEATCFTAGANSQSNGLPVGASSQGTVMFVIGGRDYDPQDPDDGDWMIDAFRLHGTTAVPTPIWMSPSAGKSTTSFDDVPAAMCLTALRNNYSCGSEPDPYLEYPRLWVTGGRTPLLGGPTEITTVQYAPDYTTPPIEWYNHFQLFNSQQAQLSALPTGVSVSVRPLNNVGLGAADDSYLTRIYVTGYCDSPDASTANTDLIMVKYDPAPSTPSPGLDKAALWHETFDLSGAERNDFATGTISVRLPPMTGTNCPPTWVNRKMLITGWHENATTGDNFVTICYQDDPG